jgi:hypothetical protein
MPSQKSLDPRAIKTLVIAGWTGRNVEALEAHIKELEELGVKRPKSVPIFFRLAASLLTGGEGIEVVGGHSSGEVEYVLYALEDGLWVGVGSDHTDRKLETMSIVLSKQVCAKPVGPQLWRYDEVAPHWDRLVLRSFVHVGKERKLYQEGPVTTMRSPEELIRLHTGGKALPSGTAMFCGTLAVHGGVAPADAFEMELEDPVLGRKLTYSYKVLALPEEA